MVWLRSHIAVSPAVIDKADILWNPQHPAGVHAAEINMVNAPMEQARVLPSRCRPFKR